MESKELKVKFEGNISSLEITTVVDTLISYSNIISEIKDNLYPDHKLKIHVKPFEKGSFIIDFQIISDLIENLKDIFTGDNIDHIKTILEILVGIFTIKQFLKGEKEKEIKEVSDSKIELKNSDNNTIIIDKRTYNLYNRPSIQEEISRAFSGLKSDTPIQKVILSLEDNSPLIEIDRENFEYFKIYELEDIDENIRIHKEVAQLHILKLWFEKGKKWTFLYGGTKINARIEDPDFERKIKSGEAFRHGDILKVELEIKQVFNRIANAYENKDYIIRKIIEHIERGQQLDLWDEESS